MARQHISFSGGKELEQALMALATKEAKRVGKQAMSKAGRTFLRAVKAAAPVDKRKLRTALRLKTDQLRYDRSVISTLIYISASKSGGSPDYRPRKTTRWTTVKGKKGPPKYAYQIGSRPDVYGMFQEFGAPAHGLPARPWFRPTWEREKDALLDIIAQELGRSISAAAIGRLAA